MLEKDQIYEFNVVGEYTDSNGYMMFEVELSKENDGRVYKTYPLKSQNKQVLPKYPVYCRVTNVDKNNKVWLEQDELTLYKKIYKEGQLYKFTVVHQLTDSLKGKSKYLIKNNSFDLNHVYVAFNNEKFEIGENIERIVGIKTTDNGGFYLTFHINKNELEGITPENIFKYIGREGDYVKYFKHVDALIGEDEDRLNDKLDEMTNKLESGNRLWLFDYITILQGAFLRIDRTQYDEMRHINKIIIDIEEWILECSGLLTKFSVEKRTETALKSEECIKRCKAYIEAIDIIEKGEQSNFLNETVSKLKMNSFIRNSQHVFSVLYNIVTLQPDFIKNNLKCLSELIEFTCKEITDTYIIGRIVSDLYQYINNEKKQINIQLHYYRSKELDTSIFTNLVIGIGTLLNFFAEKKDADINNVLEKRLRQLFPSLCKYLSFITTKDNALLLINKALKAALNNNEVYRINGTILREVGENPGKLVEYIINMDIEESKSLISNIDNIYCQYINNVLSIAHIPKKLQNKDIFDKVRNIYTIPGTFINVASLTEDKWEISDSILYYSEKWKNLHSIKNDDKLQIDDSKKATIVVKAINSGYKSIVFCSRINSIYQEDGTIHYSGYASNMFKSENLCDIFEAGMVFEADIVKREENKVSYSIINNIKQFSLIKARETNAIISGLCLNANKAKQEYVLLTENSILCIAKYDRYTHVCVGKTYEVELSGDCNEDSYPLARIIERSSKNLVKKELLKTQLREISLYNESKTKAERNPLHTHALPHIHLIIDNYLRVFDNKIILYNLYHIAYMFAKLEKSTLAEYYASCIQFMELNEYFMENKPIVYSITPTIDNEKVLSMFPSLRSRHVMKNVMTNFGSENDFEYLYNLSMNNDQDSQICKLARLSLAASLIESVSDDEKPVTYLKGIAIECLGGTLAAPNALDITSNVVENDNSEEDLNTYKNFGLESQTQEFKTSIVYLAGDNGRSANKGEQLNVIMRVICGFLNARGGTLYIGVADDGTPQGIESDLKALDCNVDKYERIIRDKIVVEFNKYVNSLIDLSFIKTYNTHTVCRIDIQESPRTISLKNGDFYQRQGNENRIIKGDDLVSLITRKAQGKDDIPFKSNVEEVNNIETTEHVERVNFTESLKHTAEPNYVEELSQKDNSNEKAIFVNFYIDGSYIISEQDIKEDNTKSIKITPENINHFILQCYSNGCINKVPVKNINNLQLGYRYKNGLNLTADLKQLVVLSDNDFVVFLSKQNNSRFIKVYPVAEISAHTTLGLKGNQLLSKNYDVIENILFLREQDKQNVEHLISRTKSNLGYNMSSVSYRNEIEWITEYIKNRKDLSVPTQVKVESEVDKILNYAYSRKEKELELFIMTYLKDGRSIPKIREIIIDVLKKCTTSDAFWFVVSVCFNCDITSFRKPITDVIKVSEYRKRPNKQALQKIVRQMFTLDQKYSQSIDFVYPIREFLSDESIKYIRERTTGLSTPEYYSMYIDIVKMTKDNSINYLLNEGSVPSLYTIFLLLEKDKNVYECMYVANRIQPINIHSRMVKDLISYILLDKTPQFTNKRLIEKIQQEGYAAFHLACVNKMQRDKLKSEANNIEEYKGKVIRAKIVQDYGHYYLLQIDSLLIILQRSWCSQTHYIGDVITVKVLSTYKKQRAMIATELIDVENLTNFEPLLNIGSEVEVKISSFNGKYVPSIRNAFSKIEANIVSYPADFDYKATYKAIVVRKRGVFNYDIRLTHKVIANK